MRRAWPKFQRSSRRCALRSVGRSRPVPLDTDARSHMRKLLPILISWSLCSVPRSTSLGRKWRLPEGGPTMNSHGVASLVIGVVGSLVLGGGLMALVFLSSRRGYDDAVELVQEETDPPPGKSSRLAVSYPVWCGRFWRTSEASQAAFSRGTAGGTPHFIFSIWWRVPPLAPGRLSKLRITSLPPRDGASNRSSDKLQNRAAPSKAGLINMPTVSIARRR
jgi:hypothetical protein